MTQKLLTLTEQEPDCGGVLELARALREQIDWTTVRQRTASSPFAKGFFTLVEVLGTRAGNNNRCRHSPRPASATTASTSPGEKNRVNTPVEM